VGDLKRHLGDTIMGTTVTRRAVAGIAFILVTALGATGCIGVAPGDLPAAGQSTRFIFHPGFQNARNVLSNPGDVKGNWYPYPSTLPTRQLREVTISWYETNPRDPSNLGNSLKERRFTPTRAANGSYYVDFTFPKNLCRTGDGATLSGLPGHVVVTTTWWAPGAGSGSDFVRVPAVSGPSCRWR